MGDGAPYGRDSVAPTRTTPRRGPRRGDPCGRPSRIQHGFVAFVRGGVPRPCGVPYRPERGHRETGMGDGAPCGRDSVGDGAPYGRDSVAPTRTTRRRGPRRGDPCGRPSRIQHGFVAFVRGGVPRPCGVPYRPERGHRETAWATARPAGAIAWATARPTGAIASPLREQLRDEARVGATLAVAHPESSTASLPSYEVACHALAASRTDPNEAIGKRHGRRRALWAR